MQTFFLCLLEIIVYTLGVPIACGLSIEICYRLCFLLMGRRAGKAYWVMTSWLGTPLHELGHALMCLLFAHHIDHIRLIPTKAGGAVVEHSYHRGNPYAAFGNLWIGLGPILVGLCVIFAVLYAVYPESMASYRAAVADLLREGRPVAQVWQRIGEFIHGLFSEGTRQMWVRALAVIVLFSMSLHVRLSASDILGMLPGVPIYLVLSALVALVFTLLGQVWLLKLTLCLRQAAWLVVSLFSLIFLLAALQLALVIVYRVLYGIFTMIAGKRGEAYEPPDPALLRDYRDRDWEEFRR